MRFRTFRNIRIALPILFIEHMGSEGLVRREVEELLLHGLLKLGALGVLLCLGFGLPLCLPLGLGAGLLFSLPTGLFLFTGDPLRFGSGFCLRFYAAFFLLAGLPLFLSSALRLFPGTTFCFFPGLPFFFRLPRRLLPGAALLFFPTASLFLLKLQCLPVERIETCLVLLRHSPFIIKGFIVQLLCIRRRRICITFRGQCLSRSHRRSAVCIGLCLRKTAFRLLLPDSAQRLCAVHRQRIPRRNRLRIVMNAAETARKKRSAIRAERRAIL